MSLGYNIHDACIHDAFIRAACIQCILYMIIDPGACVYDTPMYDPHSLTLMRVSMMLYQCMYV